MSQFYVDNNSSGGSTVDFLQGNTGGAVGPNGSNIINIVGAGAVTVTGNPGTNTLTITAPSEALTWQTITASQTLAINNGYICISPGGALALALPATSAVGSIIEITLDGATSWSVTQADSQAIVVGNKVTTTGAGGSLTSTANGDSIRMVCSIANTRWNCVSGFIGNLTVV